jgi:ribosomal protein S12 methylthiotransferase accessory factor
MSQLIRYTSSLRVATIEETLTHARRVGRDVGVVRVTDTTRLDRVGLPVYAAIRPQATRGSLCVSAGKGLRPEEAEVGACMEAIELAFAEVQRAQVKIFSSRTADVLDGATRSRAIFDLCPWRGQRIVPDVRSGDKLVVPAELVVYPYVENTLGGRSYFHSDGNGICSGNSLDEATVHGLTEVIERDATSFQNAKDTSQLIFSTPLGRTVQSRTSARGAPLRDDLPPAIAELVNRLDEQGFDLWMRHLPNDFDLPVIMAVIYERGVPDGIHYGYGCHLSSSIALVRAVSETAQCRLSAIHGGRDDLYQAFAHYAGMSAQKRLMVLGKKTASASHERNGVLNFSEVPDYGDRVNDIESALALVLEKLAKNGLRWALRAELSPPDLPVKVVRVLVPGCEVFAHGVQRMGPRLLEYMNRVRGPGAEPETSSVERSR